jgi:hypothetical protein
MQPLRFLQALLLAVPGLMTGAHAALVDRGSGLIYDDARNITWLSPNELSAYSTAPISPGWAAANDWANGVVYAGFDDWRLPATVYPDATCEVAASAIGANCTGSELGHLFYEVFGGTALQPLPASANLALLPVNSLAPYWSSTPSATAGFAYRFSMNTLQDGYGYQAERNTGFGTGAIVLVRAGDVAVVPIPAVGWMVGVGLLGLMGVGRKKKKI